MDQTPSTRFLGTHLLSDNIPASFFAKKTKMHVIFRNSKDTLVSYHFSNNNPVLPSAQSWGSFCAQFLSGDGEVGDWRNHLTAEQSREMDSAFNKHLKGTRLGDKIDYQLHCQ